MTDKEYEILEDKLKSKITPEFLETLTECVKVIGWNVDIVEVQSFVSQIYHLIGKDEYVTIEPYEVE